MLRELYDLGVAHMSKKDLSIPQLTYGNQAISLQNILEDPASIFEKLKNRICNLGDNSDVMKKPCSSSYNLLLEAIVGLNLLHLSREFDSRSSTFNKTNNKLETLDRTND